jgi:hypothetical protein
MLGVVGRDSRSCPRRLAAVPNRYCRTDRLAEPLLDSLCQPFAALSASVVHSAFVERYVPKIVPHELVAQCSEREVHIRGVSLMDTRPINQIYPAIATASYLIRFAELLRRSKTVQVMLTI